MKLCKELAQLLVRDWPPVAFSTANIRTENPRTKKPWLWPGGFRFL